MRNATQIICLLCLCSVAAFAQSFSASPQLDAAIDQAVREDRIPGAVLIVGHNGEGVHRKGYGRRAVVPQIEAMTAATIFDCASLTQAIAPTSSLLTLFEQGNLPLAESGSSTLPRV